ncbi:sensor histidine kinase [Ekhidna sp.]|uniref:sensor histidine kinase n=1 Tax=Ekhidna sp. TaxID=2608089 RepID=UPI003298F10E
MEGKVILLVIIGTIGVMLMAFSVVFFVLLYRRKMLENQLEMREVENKHQQEMLNATLKSQEEERNRLGTELHDGVGAMLSSIKLNLQVAKKKDTVETLDSVLGHLDETITQVRGISHQMMPIILKKYGLKHAITDLFEKVSSDDFEAAISRWDDPDLDDTRALMLYRIVQELLNNSIKHAEASSISFSIQKGDAELVMEYVDNGKGYPPHILKRSDGMGLLNIKNRSQAIGAILTFSNREDGGSKVNLVIAVPID